jgi:hypothetical protein
MRDHGRGRQDRTRIRKSLNAGGVHCGPEVVLAVVEHDRQARPFVDADLEQQVSLDLSDPGQCAVQLVGATSRIPPGVHPALPAPRSTQGVHRIRHYGLLASAGCKANIARARELITMLLSSPGAAHAMAITGSRERLLAWL